MSRGILLTLLVVPMTIGATVHVAFGESAAPGEDVIPIGILQKSDFQDSIGQMALLSDKWGSKPVRAANGHGFLTLYFICGAGKHEYQWGHYVVKDSNGGSYLPWGISVGNPAGKPAFIPGSGVEQFSTTADKSEVAVAFEIPKTARGLTFSYAGSPPRGVPSVTQEAPARRDALAVAQWTIGPASTRPTIKTPVLPGSRFRLLASDAKKFVEIGVKLMGSSAKMNESLDAKAGERLVVVPISWTIQDPVKATAAKIGNLSFFAAHQGSQPRRGVAICLEPPREGALWCIPDSGSGIEFEMEAETFPKFTVGVAFLVPLAWTECEVGRDRQSIGVARISTGPSPDAAGVPATPAGDQAATVSAGASQDTQFTLKVRIGLEKGKISDTTPVALLQSLPPKLSSTESEIAEQAVACLLDSCKSDEEAFSVLVETVPERAFPRCAQVFAEASTKLRQAMVRSAAKRSEPAAIALVVRGLMDADKDVRSMTTSALRAAEKALPVDALFAACKTASPEEICRALEHVGDKEAASALPAIKALAVHKDPAVRAKVLEKVGQAGDVSLAYGLRRSLLHPSPLVRGSALRGLAALKHLTEEDLLAAAPGKGDEASLAVLELLKPTNNATLRAVVDDAFAAGSGEPRKRSAIAAMGRLGHPADIPQLARCLKEDSAKETRAAAAKALGGHPQITDFAPLLAAARGETEKESDVRSAAGRALASSKEGLRAALADLKPSDSSGWSGMVSALAAQDPPDPEALASVIQRQGPKESGWDALADACAKLAPAARHRLLALILERGDGRGQSKAIKDLQAEGTADARQVLRAACAYAGVLPSRTVDVRLNFVGGGDRAAVLMTALLTMESVDANMWELLLEALRSLKDPGLPAAEAALLKSALASTDHPEAEVRAGAVRVIARFGLADNIKVVWKAMQDKESAVREAFAEVLKGLTPGQAAPALQHLAADAESKVRRTVARVAAGLGGDEMLPVLKKLLIDPDSDARTAAIAGIAKFPAHSALSIDAAAGFTSHDSQAVVADALADLPPVLAAANLTALAVRAKDDDLAVKAIEKLFRLTEAGKMERAQAATALRTIVDSASAPRKLVAVCTLAAIGDPSGLAALLDFPETGRSCRRCILTAEFGKGTEKQPLIGPERVNLVALLSFQSGYTSMGFYNTTYFFNLPLRMPRGRARFGGGDRWPLDVQHTLSGLDPVLLALATYHDPRADAKLAEAVKSTNANMRRSALWGLALRDDCPRVEALLSDPDSTVSSDSIFALRLLGHRSSLGALAPKIKGSVPAAMAAVELALAPARESKADGPARSRP